MSKISSDTQKNQSLEASARRLAEVEGCVNFFIQKEANDGVRTGIAMQLVGVAISAVGTYFVDEGIQKKDIIVTCVGSAVTLLGVGALFFASQLFSRSVDDEKMIQSRVTALAKLNIKKAE
ncbi:MAG TPA: hypothetical protein VLE96_02490 [Chlamydiales bacterium]|nr:hypothetical protein [Chlamydiales bacterium]